MPRMLYAKALFSPVAHARIKRIDTTAAEALPGVVRVITAADIPGENKVGHLKHDQYSLIPIGGLTHYLGDAIALVVAETPEILEKAKKANIATLNKAANTIIDEISTSMTYTENTELLTDVASYSIGETDGFPAEQYRATGDVHGASCVMSTDLTADVLSLHQFLFGDVGDYQPSSEVQSIAAKVHSDTGK